MTLSTNKNCMQAETKVKEKGVKILKANKNPQS